MLRALAKTGICRTLHRAGVDGWVGRIGNGGKAPVVIAYHSVVERFPSRAGARIPAQLITCQTLERHLDWLGRHFRFVSLDDLGSWLESRRRTGPPPVAITFDDGYRDIYCHAFPILQRKGIPAAVFVVSGMVDARQPLVPLLHDRLHHLLVNAFSRWPASRGLRKLLRDAGLSPARTERVMASARDSFAATRALLVALSQEEVLRIVEILQAKFQAPRCPVEPMQVLSWPMISEMHRAGITIGSHTRTHPWLVNEDPRKVREEIAGSRQELEAKLGAPVRHFAYPDGRFNAATVQAVAAAGFRYAYTTCQHQDPESPLLTIPRRVFWENSCLDSRGSFSPAVLSCQVNGLFDLLTRCDQDHHSPLAEPLRSPQPVAVSQSQRTL